MRRSSWQRTTVVGRRHAAGVGRHSDLSARPPAPFSTPTCMWMSCAAVSCGVGKLCVSVDEGVLSFALIWLRIWMWCPVVVAGD